jgi:thiamine biosynthesis lipoprotein
MTSADKTKSHSFGWLFCIAGLLTLLLAACAQEPGLVKLSGPTMGTSWHVSYAPEVKSPAQQDVEQAIKAILDEVNDSMSTYLSESEINAFNRAEPGQWFVVSPQFSTVLAAALDVGRRSLGAYDVTVAPLVDLWGFGPEIRSDDIPTDEQIALLIERVGQDKLAIDDAGGAIVKHGDIALDFSSIAKGFAVDRVAHWLTAQGIEHYLVEIGGEMRVAGQSARGDAWRIAIEQPESGGRSVARAIQLGDIAVATSGDYRNFFEHDGRRYSHSIDPRTGFPVEHDLVSVTVLHPSAMMADAWATALTVLGTEQAMAVAQEQGLAVYLIRREGDSFVDSYSDTFKPYIE